MIGLAYRHAQSAFGAKTDVERFAVRRLNLTQVGHSRRISSAIGSFADVTLSAWRAQAIRPRGQSTHCSRFGFL